METTILIILMAAALVILAIVVGLLVLHLFNKNDELKEKNDVIVREVRRNQLLIDRAVQNGVNRSAMLGMLIAILTSATMFSSYVDDEPDLSVLMSKQEYRAS